MAANSSVFLLPLQGQGMLPEQLIGQQNDSNLSAGSSRQSDDHPIASVSGPEQVRLRNLAEVIMSYIFLEIIFSTLVFLKVIVYFLYFENNL